MKSHAKNFDLHVDTSIPEALTVALSQRAKASQRGTALMFALMVLFILSIGTSVLWKQLHGNLAQQRRTWHQEQAYQLAEAGFEHAVASLRASSGKYQGEQDNVLGGGAWSVTVTPGDRAGEYHVEAWSQLEGAAYHANRARIRGHVRLVGSAVVEYAWEPIRGRDQ